MAKKSIELKDVLELLPSLTSQDLINLLEEAEKERVSRIAAQNQKIEDAEAEAEILKNGGNNK